MHPQDTRPTWVDVYRAFRDRIDKEELAPGTDLPTISELAASAELTPYGARRALERLRQEGRAQSWQGKGYRVSMPMIEYTLTARQPVFGEHMRAIGLSYASEVSSNAAVSMSGEIADRMRTRPGAKAVRIETLRRVNGRPVALSIDHFLRRRLDGIDATLRKTKSVTRSLEAHGVLDFTRDQTELEARLPSAHEALMLAIPRKQPVYVTIGTNLDQRGQPVQVSKGIWRSDCVRYKF